MNDFSGRHNAGTLLDQVQLIPGHRVDQTSVFRGRDQRLLVRGRGQIIIRDTNADAISHIRRGFGLKHRPGDRRFDDITARGAGGGDRYLAGAAAFNRAGES